MTVNAKGHNAVDEAMPNAVVKKPAQKKATTKLKPKSEEVIDISSNAEEVKKEKPVVNKEKTEQQSLKNKAPTLTSTLTTRSKAYYGLNYKPKEQIVDIDVADVNNDLDVVEYVEEIYKFFKLVEAPSVSTSGPSYSRSDLRLLLGVLGASLAPVHVSNNGPLLPEEDNFFFHSY
ncbi:Cyclin-B1-1 [Abeliophyllum distichum]|uniref:Cyclin-B1-1 n=1 Tax=Abeliophyllum distichum TaxID=126358 RepID=A0ABD1PR25_9LAMI